MPYKRVFIVFTEANDIRRFRGNDTILYLTREFRHCPELPMH